MDGVDIAYSEYSFSKNQWSFNLLFTETIQYTEEIISKLKKSDQFSARNLLELDKELGLFYSNCVNQFISKNNIEKNEINAISSHGHTIFHQPKKGYTYQIGCGDTIAYHTGINVINDFRQKDVVAGGQGAPLVPIGDKLLFSGMADTFLNLGGFANCTTIQKNDIIAFDICPANLPLNRITQEIGLAYDKDGEISRTGNINQVILENLNKLPFYNEKPPKSLGTEWLNSEFNSKINPNNSKEDQLATITEHIAYQIGKAIKETKAIKVYATGGGAKNKFLMERIKANTNAKIIIPETEIIDFKEAIIFGFLAVLFIERLPNTLSKVTGAKHNTIGGVLHIY